MSQRRIYEKEHGAIPEGTHVHHLCGRSDCRNPEHLIALLPHDHWKFHRYLCDMHETSRVIVKERKSEPFYSQWTKEELDELNAAIDRNRDVVVPVEAEPTEFFVDPWVIPEQKHDEYDIAYEEYSASRADLGPSEKKR